MGKKIILFLLPLTLLMAEQVPSSKESAIMREEERKETPTNETSVLISEKPKPKEIIQNIPEEGTIDIKEIFLAAPIIYTLLLAMSVSSVVIWIMSLFSFKEKNFIPADFVKTCRQLLLQKEYEKAKEFCETDDSILAKMIIVGINTKNLGAGLMIDAMKSEGRRVSTSCWQRLTILNDIVMIAPMLGLLGTVMGMFYAFYDINRSVESITALFDGLGIAVGTTVFGLFVAIAAMIFSTTLKYRLVKLASLLEKEALSLGRLVESNLKGVEEKVAELQKKSLEKKRKTAKASE